MTVINLKREGIVEQAASAIVQLDDRRVVLRLIATQLATRRAGDLITAEIVAVEPLDKSA